MSAYDKSCRLAVFPYPGLGQDFDFWGQMLYLVPRDCKSKLRRRNGRESKARTLNQISWGPPSGTATCKELLNSFADAERLHLQPFSILVQSLRHGDSAIGNTGREGNDLIWEKQRRAKIWEKWHRTIQIRSANRKHFAAGGASTSTSHRNLIFTHQEQINTRCFEQITQGS